MLVSAKTAVQIVLALIGVMAVWLGLMKVAEESGLLNLVSRAIRPAIDFLFPDLKKMKKPKVPSR